MTVADLVEAFGPAACCWGLAFFTLLGVLIYLAGPAFIRGFKAAHREWKETLDV